MLGTSGGKGRRTNLGDGKVAVVKRGGVELDEYVVLADVLYLGFLGLQTVKVFLAAGDYPLLQ